MSRSSLWATGLWVWPYVSRLPCLLHAPCGLCEQHRVSNVILWTLGGKKSQSSLKRERQKKREEVIQSHVWNGIWGGRHDQRLPRRRMAGAHCVSPWSTVNACQHMFEHACAHIVYMVRKLSVSVCFFFLKVLKGKSSGEKMMKRVLKSDSEMFVLLATSVHTRAWYECTCGYTLRCKTSPEIDVNTSESHRLCLPVDFYCTGG